MVNKMKENVTNAFHQCCILRITLTVVVVDVMAVDTHVTAIVRGIDSSPVTGSWG